jgi:hypothetical protein
MNNIIAKTTRIVVAAAALILAVMAFNPPASAQDHAGPQSGQEMKAPQTAPEHRERAEYYKKKAAEYRAEAESHKKMQADYNKGVAKNPKDTGENPYVKKMRLHCEKYINAAENLAREADEMAKFHEMRAKEVEGK